MFKKIITVTGILLVIGILFWGAINRTQAKNYRENQYKHQNGYSNHQLAPFASLNQFEQFRAQGQRGNGNRRGAFQSALKAFSTSPASQTEDAYQPQLPSQDLFRQNIEEAQHTIHGKDQQRRGFGRGNRSNSRP